MLDMQGLWRNEQPFSSHLFVEKGKEGMCVAGGTHDWESCPKNGNGTKKIKNGSVRCSSTGAFLPALNRGRRAWMWSGWKDLEEEERHRKVLLLEPLSLPLHFAHCQAHYLISLATLHYDRILTELKANLQWHAALENCDEKKKKSQIKRYQFRNMVKDAAGCWI